MVLQVNSLRDVNSRYQTYQMEVYLRLFWFDYRLAYDGDCVPLGPVGSLAYDEETEYAPQGWNSQSRGVRVVR